MIIAFVGKAGSGKDHVASLLGEIVPINRYAFANKLKFIALSLGWNGQKDERGRRFLQHLGQCAREYNENVWVDMVIAQIKANRGEVAKIDVITDARFPNEIRQLEETIGNVITIRVVGQEEDLDSNADDISEHSLDDYQTDYVINNQHTSGEILKYELKQIIVKELE